MRKKKREKGFSVKLHDASYESENRCSTLQSSGRLTISECNCTKSTILTFDKNTGDTALKTMYNPQTARHHMFNYSFFDQME